MTYPIVLIHQPGECHDILLPCGELHRQVHSQSQQVDAVAYNQHLAQANPYPMRLHASKPGCCEQLSKACIARNGSRAMLHHMLCSNRISPCPCFCKGGDGWTPSAPGYPLPWRNGRPLQYRAGEVRQAKSECIRKLWRIAFTLILMNACSPFGMSLSLTPLPCTA